MMTTVLTFWLNNISFSSLSMDAQGNIADEHSYRNLKEKSFPPLAYKSNKLLSKC